MKNTSKILTKKKKIILWFQSGRCDKTSNPIRQRNGLHHMSQQHKRRKIGGVSRKKWIVELFKYVSFDFCLIYILLTVYIVQVQLQTIPNSFDDF